MTTATLLTPGIASIDGAFPDAVQVAITRVSIEDCDPAPALAKLRGLTSDRSTVIAMRGRLMLTVTGYDNDPRILWAVPEVQRCAAKLINQWPYLLWFMTLRDDLHSVTPPELAPLALVFDETVVGWIISEGVVPESLNQDMDHCPHPLDRGTIQIRDRGAIHARLKLLLDNLLDLATNHDIPGHLVSARVWAITKVLERSGLVDSA